MSRTASRMMTFAGALALLLAVGDFSSRVYVGRNSGLHEFSAPPPLAASPAPDSAGIRAQLADWLPALSEAPREQADPNSLEAWDLALRGVFRERNKSFVVIIARPRAGGGAAVPHRLGLGDALLGLSVAEIRGDSVTLQGPGGPRELTLYPRKPGTP